MNATLIAETQARVNALDGTEPVAKLLQLSSVVQPLLPDVDATNLIVKLNLKADAVTSATDLKDLVAAANGLRGATNDGSSSSGGGGGIPINGVMPINDYAPLSYSGDEVYLRNGFMSTDPQDLIDYPDALRSMVDLEDVGFTFPTETGLSPRDICHDGEGKLWVLYTTNAMYQYNTDGSPTGVVQDISANAGVTIEWGDGYFWALNSNGNLHKIPDDWTSPVESFQLSSTSSYLTMTYANGLIYAVRGSNVEIYSTNNQDASWEYIDIFDVASAISSNQAKGAFFDGSAFCVTAYSTGILYRNFDNQTAADNNNFPIDLGRTFHSYLGATMLGGYVWFSDYSTKLVHKYQIANAIGTRRKESSVVKLDSAGSSTTTVGLPLYTRIK